MDTALLVIDIQNDYFPGGANPLHGADEAAGKAARLVAFFRAKGWPVVFIQHLSNRPGAAFFVPGTHGAEIAQGVRPLPGEKVVVKHFPNSFRETELGAHLASLGTRKLVVCGMMTHMCVDATVRAAKDFGYEVTLAGDACATRELACDGAAVAANSVHAAFLAALSYYYAELVKTEPFIEKRREVE